MYRLLNLLLLSIPSIYSNETLKESLRIYKGSDVDMGQYPHAVFLMFQITRPSSCGASLLTNRTVLTNAYCAEERDLQSGRITAYLGATVPRSSLCVRHIVDHIIHPKYDGIYKNNLAVLLMDRPVPVNGYIKPIPLVKGMRRDTSAIVVGWGRQSIIPNHPGKLPPDRKLRHLSLSKQELVDKSLCEPSLGFRLGPATICARAVKGSFVHLDELGDGLLFTKPNHSLLGVLSNVRNSYAVFSSVTFNREWILSTAYHIVQMHENPNNKTKG